MSRLKNRPGAQAARTGGGKAKRSSLWLLVLYDLAIMTACWFVMSFIYSGTAGIKLKDKLIILGIFILTVYLSRIVFRIYRQIWRYGGIQVFIRLILADILAFCILFIVLRVTPLPQLSFPVLLSLVSTDLLVALSMRMFYRYAYKVGNSDGSRGRFFAVLVKIFSFGRTTIEGKVGGPGTQKTGAAIIGAGTAGIELAEDLMSNRNAPVSPKFLIDASGDKIGREVHGLPVFSPDSANTALFEEYRVSHVVIAIPDAAATKKKKLYEHYSGMGLKVMIYDYPVFTSGGRMMLREVSPEDLLFRKPRVINDEKTAAYYEGKSVLVTGGGGSIGSELCRKVAAMKPSRLVILDICENGAYDLQQELRSDYGDSLALYVEICSVTNRNALRRAFERHRPQTVIMAAAHKHVPLMENNCIEAVENNIFGTLTTVEVSEEFGVERVIMVSTDKAVNPTNVMGATKRFCEMIVQAHSGSGREGVRTTYSATRFGNVLGSAGSVIPLFKRQIEKGGPVTLTDRRVIRYFMTIPEASQLVLQSGAMAKNGELFVLDMGEPVRILDLAESLIRFSGYEPGVDIEIKEIGLRPGEKLYEELLVRTDGLEKTDSDLIFVEREPPPSLEEIEEKLRMLKEACETNSDRAVYEALRKAVPTFRTPGEVNSVAEKENRI